MATVDQLIVEIKAETKGLRQGLDAVNHKLAATNKTAKSSVLNFGNLAKVFATIGLARLGGAVVTTSRQFQDLEATLRAITGSAENAANSMDLVRKFTMGTTFQLQNVSSAFTTLLNAGIAPTSDTLKDFGNLAAAFGKDITQIAQATFNATTGETEMLKQFGIKAKLEGDKISMIFREQETVIGRNSTEIVEYLRNIAQENFDTALEERLNTVSGVFSNLGDMVSETFNAIGEGGLNEALTRTGKKILSMGEAAKVVGNIIGQGLLIAFKLLRAAVMLVVDNMRLLTLVFVAYVAYKAPVLLTLAFGRAMTILSKSIAGVRIALALLAKSPFFIILTVATVGIGTFTTALDDLGKKMGEMAGSLLEGMGLNDLFTIPEDSTKSVEELDAEILAMAEAMKDADKAAKEVTTTIGTEMKSVILNASSNISNDFVQALMDGKDALETFKNFAKNIVQQIIATFLQMAVVNQILNSVFNLGGTPDALPTIKLAGGGHYSKGKPTIVGERGPEMMIPNTSGTIMNNMNTRNAMGGGGGVTVVQNNNFALGVGATARAEVQKMLPQIAETSKMAVFEAAARGGAYRKGLLGGT